MELRDDKINVVELASMNKAFRNSIRDGASAILVPATNEGIEVFSLKDILKDMTPPKIEHSCNGERYLSSCKACKINSWRFNGLSEYNIDLLLSLEAKYEKI